MTIKYHVPGVRRKELVSALSAMLNTPPEYQGAPSFAYKVGGCTVTKDGALIFPDSTIREIVEQIVGDLQAEGFIPESAEDNLLAIAIPRHLLDNGALTRLEQILASKSELFKRAFQMDALILDKSADEIRFPWFRLTGIDGEAEAYGNFITKLWQFAVNRRRITAKPYASGNDKFAMRLFLVQLGLNGPKNKRTRKILTMNLEGNTAWKNGAPAHRRNPNEK